MPKLYTGPRTIAGGDGDDTHTFKLQIHSTGATTGWAKLWIDGQQVKGDMWSVFTPEHLDYTGEDLSSAQVLVGVMSGNNPNNPAHTFSWSDLTVTGCLDPYVGKELCKKGGWESFTNPSFKNQGQCVSYFAKMR